VAVHVPQVFEWEPELLARAESLEWRSRILVEGFLQGFHHSRLRGFSSEFSQYQPYIHGDDLRYMDWRAYARLDRLYIRQFEAETNLRCQILIDASASMDYRSQGTRFRKYDYATLLAAAMMRLLQKQNDAFGLSLGGKTLREHHPSRLSRAHFLRCLGAMETAKLSGTSDLGTCINDMASLFKRRGLVVIFTDAWDDLTSLSAGLQRLRYEQHDVSLFQIVDPRELDFDFTRSDLFEDIESGQRLPINPQWNKPKYMAALEAHQTQLRKICLDSAVTLHTLRTTDAPFQSLATFLAERGRGA